MQHFDTALVTPVILQGRHSRHPKPDNPGLSSGPAFCLLRAGLETPWGRRTIFAIASAALLSLAACANRSGPPSASLQGKPLSGYVEMSQVQAAYIGSNISALIKALLLQHPYTVLEIRAPAGGFIAAFAAAISPIGKTAGAKVFC